MFINVILFNFSVTTRNFVASFIYVEFILFSVKKKKMTRIYGIVQ